MGESNQRKRNSTSNQAITSLEARELKECTFNPKINSASKVRIKYK